MYSSSVTDHTFTGLVSYKKQDQLTLRESLGSPPDFLVGSVLLIVSVFSVGFLLCLSSSCVPSVASVSGLSLLDCCPFGFLEHLSNARTNLKSLLKYMLMSD